MRWNQKEKSKTIGNKQNAKAKLQSIINALRFRLLGLKLRELLGDLGNFIQNYQTWIIFFMIKFIFWTIFANENKLTIYHNDDNFTCCQSVLPVASCLTTSATSVTPILEQRIFTPGFSGCSMEWIILSKHIVNLIWVVESLSLRVTECGAFKESKSTVIP